MTELSVGTPSKVSFRFIGWLLISLIIIIVKSNSSLLHPQLWAEDGAIFLKQQLEWRSPLLLFMPYAGYLHATPRLVAWFASNFSAVYSPAIYNTCAVLISAFAVTIAIKQLADLVPPPIILGAVLLTPTNGEIFGNITNVQWFMQFALLTCCFIAPRAASVPSRIAIRVFVAVAALTGPFSILCLLVMMAAFFGFIFARIFASRDYFSGAIAYFSSRDFVCWAIVGIGAIVQLKFFLTTDSPHAAPIPILPLIVGTFGQAFPLHLLGFLPPFPPVWPFLFFGIPLYMLLLSKESISNRIGFTIFYSFSLLEVLAGSHKVTFQEMLTGFSSDRYMLMLKIASWAFVYILLKDLEIRRAVAAGISGALLILVAIPNRDHLLRPELINYDATEAFRSLDNPGTHVVPINPRGWDQTINVPN